MAYFQDKAHQGLTAYHFHSQLLVKATHLELNMHIWQHNGRTPLVTVLAQEGTEPFVELVSTSFLLHGFAQPQPANEFLHLRNV